MRALAKWGMPLLEEPNDDHPIRPWTAVFAAIGPYHDPLLVDGADERYQFVIDGTELTLSSRTGRGTGDGDDADLVLESDARLWLDVRQGRTTVRHAIDEGRLAVIGDAGALANLQRIFDLA
jgi:hypothetical protein